MENFISLIVYISQRVPQLKLYNFIQHFIYLILCISQRMPHLSIQHFKMHVRNFAKNTYHYLMFVRTSVRMYQRGLLWVYLLEIWYWGL